MTRLDSLDQDVFVEVVNFLELPTEEVVIHNADDSYTIFINANIAHDRQVQAVEHAMEHIVELDFEKENVQEIEFRAHHIASDAPKAKRRRRKYWEMTREERDKRIDRIIRKQLKYLKEKYSDRVEGYHRLCEERMKYDPQFFEEHNIFW